MSVGELAMTPGILTRRGLLLQRLSEVAIARLLLVNKPCVLDRDDCLVGEGFEQLLICLSERWTDLSSADMDRADGNAFAE